VSKEKIVDPPEDILRDHCEHDQAQWVAGRLPSLIDPVQQPSELLGQIDTDPCDMPGGLIGKLGR
jgi:hypothetical protein